MHETVAYSPMLALNCGDLPVFPPECWVTVGCYQATYLEARHLGMLSRLFSRDLPTYALQVAGSLAMCNHRNCNLKLTFYGLKELGLHFLDYREK